MPPEAISTAYLKNPSLISSTNITASQVVEVIPFILLEFLN
jgi:hypothetical protein